MYLILGQGRYLPVYASAVYDQNTYLIARNMTPVNLVSVAIGQYVPFHFRHISLKDGSGNGATDFWA